MGRKSRSVSAAEADSKRSSSRVRQPDSSQQWIAVAQAVHVEEREREQETVVGREAPGIDQHRAFAQRLPCVITAPLAGPVVPDV